MNTIRTMSIVFVLLAFWATNAFGGDASSRETGDRRHGPPPEAYTACEGKSPGDVAQFISPRGETVTGTCELEGDRLVLRPDRHRGNAGNRHHGPPPEAYTACKGKNPGDVAQFIGPCGETVTGTCEMEGDRLVLRPDRSKGNGDSETMKNPTE